MLTTQCPLGGASEISFYDSPQRSEQGASELSDLWKSAEAESGLGQMRATLLHGQNDAAQRLHTQE